MNKNIKKIVATSVFLVLFIITTVFIFITPTSTKSTYGLTTTTEDGVIVSFNVFEPAIGGNNKKAVIIGHGSMANKEMMKGYAIELAAAGFVAIPFDFRGHGFSLGERGGGDLTSDIKAIKNYLSSRPDIDIHNLGYIGLSMGGVGQVLFNEDLDFKCFIGTATWLRDSLRKGNSSAPLNVLMIAGLYDELLNLEGLEQALADRVGISVNDIDTNQIYGSFQEGNASMIYLDDNANHVFSQWDADFHREARDWVINTFPDVRRPDENFYSNIRVLILLFQVLSGLGFFVLLSDPICKVILKDKERETESFAIELTNTSIKALSIKTILYSLILGIPGILIMFLINLPLFLAIEGFVLSLLFGQAFALLLLLWRAGKQIDLSLLDIIKKPFKESRERLLRQIGLGAILALILYLILYFSVGLNYLAMLPSITKMLWVPIYVIMTFFVFLFYGLHFQLTIQEKFEKNVKGLIKSALLNFGFIYLYMFVYILILSLAIRSFFYFGFFIPLSIPVFLVISFIWAILYRKTGNIIVGAIVPSLFVVMFVSTSAQLQPTISFILNMIF